MNAADGFVMSSVSEGLPFALLEAALLKKPIVATNVGHIPDTLGHGTDAFIVPPRDSTALARAMDRLLDNPLLAQTLGRNARKSVLERYGIAAAIKGCRQAYSTAWKYRKKINKRKFTSF